MGSSTVLPVSRARSTGRQPCDGLLPVSEWKVPPTRLVALQVLPPSVTSQPNPPGTKLCDGPVQPVSDVLGSLIVHSVGEDDGMPPPVCATNSHNEKISGSTAVPPPGAPQATVAVAET